MKIEITEVDGYCFKRKEQQNTHYGKRGFDE